MPNATYLTEKYPGQEKTLWTPCIYSFFEKYRPLLPVSVCLETPSENGPWFGSRKQSPYLMTVDAEFLLEPTPIDFLQCIGKKYETDLISDQDRYTAIGDISGIYPDIVLLKPNRQGVSIIENKPYDGSSFTGNQGAGSAYIYFVNWLKKSTIPCEYILIHSIGWKQKMYLEEMEIQNILKDRFGVILLEDIFAAMDKSEFEYAYDEHIMNSWKEYTDKGSDYA